MSNQSKKLHFSPLLGIILTTTTVWVAERPLRGQNVPSVASIKDPEATDFEFLENLTWDSQTDEYSTEVEPYTKVSDIKEGVSSPVKSQDGVKEPIARDSSPIILEGPWLEESRGTIDPYPRVSTIQATTEVVATEDNHPNLSDAWLEESSEAINPYPRVSQLKEVQPSPEPPSQSSTAPPNHEGLAPQLTVDTVSQANLGEAIAPELTQPPEIVQETIPPELTQPAEIAQETIPLELTQPAEIAQETTPPSNGEDIQDRDIPVVPTPEVIPAPEGETEEIETSEQEPRVLVVEVVVEGAERELENLVYNTIQTRPGRTATRSQLQEDVNAIYATGFFANVEVTPADTPLGVRITYAVEVNPVLEQVVVSTVPDVEDERALPPEKVQEIFGEQYGKTLNLRDLQEGIGAINEWYAEQGFDLAQVIGSPEVSEDGIVTLVIAEGVIEDIQVRFFDPEDEPLDGRTRDFIVTREMQLKPGTVFNRRTAQFDLQRIFGLGLFEDVRVSFSPGEDPREVIVNVDVVEGNTGSLAAGTGISSSSGLFGTISYQEQNLGGNGQTIGGEVQVGERELLLDVSFTDPWIAGDPFRTAYTVNGFRRRTISLVFDGDDSSIRTLNGFDSPRVIRTGGGVSFARPIADNPFTKPDWRLTAGVNYQRVQIENADGDIAPLSAPLNGFPEQPLAFSDSGRDDLLTLSFAAAQDFRNNPLRPTSGYVLRLGVEQTLPVGSGSVTFTRLRGNYSYFLPLDFIDLGFIEEDQPKPQALAFNVQAGTVLEDLPPYEAFVVGGSNSVRGYAEGEVGNGRSYFQATAEYRFPIIPAVGAALFFDYGTTIKSQRSVRGIPGVVRGLPSDGYGYGLGVRIQSPVGPIRVDYGINDDGDSRIHFGIGERF
ncbi:Outer membrane protein/protective antigen OMA87 [Crocosphaera watsonii WH 0401]|uniref:Outer membrane protein/protective antigen OMA87 n=1 Tax=Crocosphaera watsonii WH 0401 TaxID=555881 RepID=T2JAM3_CROWT|nr:BamA/TamA family outer membrane protein [Crocosphaera watsonii]CCQ61542.1 Outer membrane protein/protective antigen OMA87 [Crocosphaera watsonii WH 0401]